MTSVKKQVNMPRMGLSGYVRSVQVIKPATGEVARELGGHSNLILDQGLDEVANRHLVECFEYCAVGTGDSTPTEGQTELDNEIARTDEYNLSLGENGTFTFISDEGETPAWWTNRRTFDFPEGTLDSSQDGDYEELGFSWSGDSGENLFARALIKDDQGNPTPVSVADDEILRVTYDLVIDLSPVESGSEPDGVADSFDISGIGTINGRHLVGLNTARTVPSLSFDDDVRADNGYRYFQGDDSDGNTLLSVINQSDGTSAIPSGADISVEPSEPGLASVYNGLQAFSAIMPNWTETYSRDEDSEVEMTLGNYTEGSFEVTRTAVWDTGEGNFEVDAVGMSSTPQRPSYVFKIDDGDEFTKDDEHELTIDFKISWGRADD